jgi:hypothetical protein
MIVVVKIPTGGVAGVHDCRAHSPRRGCLGHCHILSYSTVLQAYRCGNSDTDRLSHNR